MDDIERLEGMEEILQRLSVLAEDHIILVEGNNDVAALRRIGVDGEFFCVQVSGGPVKAAEYAWRSGKPCVILTDRKSVV